MQYNLRFFKKSFSRRLLILSGFKLLIIGVLSGRIWWLQVKERKKYFDLSEGNRIDIRFLLPNRGRIITSDLQAIADVKPKFNVVLIPYRVKSLEKTLKKLSEFIDITAEKKEELIQKNKHFYRYAFITITSLDEWEEAMKLSSHLYDMPAIDVQVSSQRDFPTAHLFSHVTGYVGYVSKKDQERDPSSFLKIPNAHIGKQGLERAYDKRLRGHPGNVRYEVDHIGSIKREVDRQDPIPGEDLHITLNHSIQQVSADAMQEQSGASVLINIKTGEILSLYSSPTFDPNLFTNGIGHADWNALIQNQKAPMNNKAIIGQYPPGSTFKMITLIAALEAGVIKPDETIYCNGHYKLNKSRFHCWKYSGHGAVNAVQSLQKSCDVYFYELSQRVGIDRISQIAYLFGLGAKTNIALPYEKAGLVANREWKKKRYDKDWKISDTIISSIGQGSMLTTPIQLAVMTARIASKKMVTPHLIQQKNHDPFPLISEVSDETMQVIQQGMFDVVNSPGGTAPSGRIPKEYGFAAGKTGTAQVRRISRAERRKGVLKNNQLDWKYRDHALYTAFAPFDDPLYAVATIVEHGGSGSKVAAPIATKILKAAFTQLD